MAAAGGNLLYSVVAFGSMDLKKIIKFLVEFGYKTSVTNAGRRTVL